MIKAARDLGFGIEVAQEVLADSAQGAGYANYVKAKRDLLDSIRAQTAHTYANLYQQYLAVGYEKKKAKEMAKAAAMSYKDSQMTIFYTLYPKSIEGQRVLPTY